MALNSLPHSSATINTPNQAEKLGPDSDAYFSADVETDGPIPGPFSMLSFALVYAGSFDRRYFYRPNEYHQVFYAELKPISDQFDPEALRVNGLDRERLKFKGTDPVDAMSAAAEWVKTVSGPAHPVLVAYPLSFDWSWLYWYFVRFVRNGSPFAYSRCYDIKTAYAVKASVPIWDASRSHVNASLKADHNHTHRAVDDAIAQAEIFANVFEWEEFRGRTFRPPL